MSVAHEFKAGDRVVWNGEPGTFLRYTTESKYFPAGTLVAVLKWDSDSDNGIEQEDEAEHVEPFVALTIEDVAIKNECGKPIITGNDYIITDDGTIYTLTRQYAHGLVCAILFPDIAKTAGFQPPAHGASSWHDYQRFELDYHESLPVIRVSHGSTVSTWGKGATPAQVDAYRRAMLANGLTLQDEVETDYRTMTLRAALKELGKSHD